MPLGSAASSSSNDSPTTNTGRVTPAAATLGISSGVVTTATAPDSATMCASSGAVTRKTTGVTTAPARQIAW